MEEAISEYKKRLAGLSNEDVDSISRVLNQDKYPDKYAAVVEEMELRKKEGRWNPANPDSKNRYKTLLRRIGAQLIDGLLFVAVLFVIASPLSMLKQMTEFIIRKEDHFTISLRKQSWFGYRKWKPISMSPSIKVAAILAIALAGCNQRPLRLESKLSHFEQGWFTLTGLEANPVRSTLPIYTKDIRDLDTLVLQPKSEIPYCHIKYRVEFEKFHLEFENASLEELELEYCWNGSAHVTFRDSAKNQEFYDIDGSETNRVLTKYFEANDGKWVSKSFDLHKSDLKMAYAELNQPRFLFSGTRFLCDTVIGSLSATFRDTKENHVIFESIQSKYCRKNTPSKGCGD